MKYEFPTELFVTQEYEKKEAYYLAFQNNSDCAEIGKKTKVGVYKFVELREVEGVVNSRAVK